MARAAAATAASTTLVDVSLGLTLRPAAATAEGARPELLYLSCKEKKARLQLHSSSMLLFSTLLPAQFMLFYVSLSVQQTASCPSPARGQPLRIYS